MDILGKVLSDRFLSEFSEEHFLIKALNGNAEVPDNIRDAMFHYCLPMGNKRVRIDDIGFCTSFAIRTANMVNYFGERNIKKFFSSQLSAGKQKYSEWALLQALSEIACINYALCMLPGEKTAEYEPKTNGKKNPEVRIISESPSSYRYDIEVKTASFPERKEYVENRQKFLRVNIPIDKNDLDELKESVEAKGYIFLYPSIGKLKDYIRSAGEKFVLPETSEQCNVLFINWTFDDICEAKLMEPVACLCNEKTGLLKTDKYHASLGIEEALKRISAIVVYRDTVDSFTGMNLLTAVNSGNCKIIINDKFCKKVDRIKILNELRIPEANVIRDGALFEIFGNIYEPNNNASQICEDVMKIWEKQ